MILISVKSSYGLSALIELALTPEDTPVAASELARKRGIPTQFLEQICASLRRGGLLTSKRGVNGGFRLARPAEDINALEVVEILDGRLGADATGVIAEASDAARGVLAGRSIAELADAESGGGSPMYWI